MNSIYCLVMLEQALGPRSLRRLERREEILSLALATVVDRGIDSLSMNKLAKEVGFTPGALYRYFDSKDALIAELAERVLGDVMELLDTAIRMATRASPIARINALVTAYVTFSRQQPHAFGLLSLLVSHPQIILSEPEHLRAVGEKIQQVASPIVEALEDAGGADALMPGDARARAIALFAAVQGALQLRKQERHQVLNFKADHVVEHLVSTLLCGWSTQGAKK